MGGGEELISLGVCLVVHLLGLGTFGQSGRPISSTLGVIRPEPQTPAWYWLNTISEGAALCQAGDYYQRMRVCLLPSKSMMAMDSNPLQS